MDQQFHQLEEVKTHVERNVDFYIGGFIGAAIGLVVGAIICKTANPTKIDMYYISKDALSKVI